MSYIRKRYLIKVYNKTGTYLATWRTEIVSEITFRKTINSGLGELSIKLARKFDSFGEESDVKIGNEVQVWVFDRDTTSSGVKVYSGEITGYEPTLEEAGEFVTIQCIGYIMTLERDVLKDGLNTTVTYNSYDPSNILKDVIDKYAGRITYDGSSIDLTSTTVSYTFNTSTHLDAVKKCLELAPAGWYFFVDSNNKIHFHQKSSNANHTFTIGKDIRQVRLYRRGENIKNVVLFVGGGDPPLYKEYISSGSVNEYGRRVYIMQDQRVTLAATAQIMAQSFLNNNDAVEIRNEITVIDNNGEEGKGYDIESIQPGQTCRVRSFGSDYGPSLWDISQWDIDKWDYAISYALGAVMWIVNVEYHPGYAVIEVSSKHPELSHRIEDVNRNVKTYINKDNPNAPS